ncbi:MAG TPA: hypothetical protein GX510_04305 [Firmicutes bacterium]|nr:hypothetical protein [Candidatus Fermentithermobacillaceae bacterium]
MRVTRARQLLTGVVALIAATLTLISCSGRPNLTTDEKLEDFEYLFGILEQNHPFLALKTRAEGFDWVSRRAEFERVVAASKDDASLAQAIARMLREINNGHTTITSAAMVKLMAELNEEPWKEVARNASPARIDYWARLAGAPAPVPEGKYPPFLAVYNGGEYVVVAVAPDETIRQMVRPGMRVVAVEGVPVHEYVAARRGQSPYLLRYDPVRKRLYQRQLELPRTGESLRVALEEPSTGVFEARVPFASENWDHSYSWPPRYADTQGAPTANVYTAVLAGGSVGYVQITSFMNMEPALRRFFQEARDLPVLIIDIRGNRGGLSTYWEKAIVAQLAAEPVSCTYCVTWRTGEYVQPFVEAKISRMLVERISKQALVEKAGPGLAANIPPEALGDDFVDPCLIRARVLPAADSVRYRGKIYLLVDDLCFSAADGFASFCKATGFATVVGTWTGGDGIGFTPAPVLLPNSGIAVQFPVVMGLNPDFSANEETHTCPDVMVEQSVEDILEYLAAGDAVLLSGPDPRFDAALRACLALSHVSSTGAQTSR